jgi:hypothetical protein
MSLQTTPFAAQMNLTPAAMQTMISQLLTTRGQAEKAIRIELKSSVMTLTVDDLAATCPTCPT